MTKEKFSILNRLASFKHAFNGLAILWREEHNARVHFMSALAVFLLGYFLRLSTIEWLVILLTIGFVVVTEILNSSIEYLADHVTPDYHENIKKVKDMAAAGVLVSAFIAIIIGLVIFIPKIWNLIY